MYSSDRADQNSGKGETKDPREANENIRKAQDEEPTGAPVDPKQIESVALSIDLGSSIDVAAAAFFDNDNTASARYMPALWFGAEFVSASTLLSMIPPSISFIAGAAPR